MKKVNNFLLTFIITSFCINAMSQQLTYINEFNKNGKIKSIRITSYEAIQKFGEIHKGKRSRDLMEWDQHITIDYAKKIFNVRHLSSNDELEFSFKKEFDNKGNIIRETHYDSFGIQGKYQINKYDKDGNITESIVFNPNGVINTKITCKYENGKKISLDYFNSDGDLFKKETFKYNSFGSLIEINDYNSDGTIFTQKLFEYDHNNNLLNMTSYMYPNNKNRISYASKDKWVTKFYTKYNSKGLEIEAVVYEPDGTISGEGTPFKNAKEYEYEYDAKGNWIKKIVYLKNGRAQYLIEREIEYLTK